MAAWLSENLGTIIVSLIIIAMVAGAVRSIIKNKLEGKSSCGCGCSNCAMNGSCHTTKQKPEG